MKTLRLLTVLALSLAWMGASVHAESCCEKAKKAGKECEHACCKDAAKNKKTCEKCNPKKEDKK
jgi:hypothetical protein